MDHSHDHHGPKSYGRAFAIGIVLNLTFVIVEFFYGKISHSLALVADAGHNLSDVLALALAWGASLLGRTRPTQARTYGMRRSSILASLINAVVLLLVLGAISWEAMQRFNEPSPVAGRTVMWVAALGIVINGATALLFASGRHGDLNVRGAFLHMAADAAVSLGVVITGAAILYTGWQWVDPAVSLVISAVIFFGTWDLLKHSVNLALDAVPEGIQLPSVEAYLLGLPNVVGVHDLHVWGMSTTEAALTAHLVMSIPSGNNELLREIEEGLHRKFGIEHATVQLETGDRESSCQCRLLSLRKA